MIGVVYEILPLAVINSEQTVARLHDLRDNAVKIRGGFLLQRHIELNSAR